MPFLQFTQKFLTHLVDNLVPLLPLWDRVLTELQGHHGHRHNHRGVGLGGGHSDFIAGIQVHSTVSEAADGRADGVGDANTKRSSGLQ